MGIFVAGGFAAAVDEFQALAVEFVLVSDASAPLFDGAVVADVPAVDVFADKTADEAPSG